jgi:uncharacterized protein (TIGR03437 family)
LTLHYAVDDNLGGIHAGGVNPGVFLNGTYVCVNLVPVGSFSAEQTITCNDIGPVLNVGENWLYFDAVNLEAGAGLLFSATITTSQTTPMPSINSGGVVSAASYTVPVVPGSIAAAYGDFLLSSPSGALSIPLPINLSGLSMQFGGEVQAPLFYASGGQVNLQVPWELVGQTQSQLTVSIGGQTSAAQVVNFASFSPGIFSTNAQGTGQGAILDASYHLVDPSSPAVPGSTYLQIYCTGLGEVTNPPPTGSPAPENPLAYTTTTPTVTVGNVPAQVLFSGLAPGYVGLYQVNAAVPSGAPGGAAVPVIMSMPGATSNTVTIAVEGQVMLNPQPSISSLSPASATAGSGPVTLTIDGSGFIATSSVTFNGLIHQASFVNSSTLSITLITSDLGVTGSFPVVVTNPSPGGGTSNAVNFTVTAVEAYVAGIYQGTWASQFTSNSGSFGAVLTQTGSTVAGTVLLTGSSCFSIGTVSGTIGSTLSSLSLTGDFNTGAEVQFDGTGRYAVLSGQCAGDLGSWTLAAIRTPAPITGTWQGTFLSVTGLTGTLAADIAQNGIVLDATISLTGSPCFTNGTATGNIVADTISLGSAFSGGQQAAFDGTVNSTGNSISGQYAVLSGACTGDYGGFSLTTAY